MPHPALIINTPGDEHLFDRVANQLSGNSSFSALRVEGVLGRTLPDLVCRLCTNDPNSVNNKGAVAVFFAHMNAWEAVLASGSEWALVVEDDVTFDNFELFDADKLPTDFDIVFVNDRTRPNRQDRPQEIEFAPIAESIPVIEARRMSVGGDGYILSNAAARKLLEAVKIDKFFSHVDLRLLAYCLSIEDAELYCAAGPVSRELRDISRLLRRYRYLSGFSSYPSLVTHKLDRSRRAREDELGRGSTMRDAR